MYNMMRRNLEERISEDQEGGHHTPKDDPPLLAPEHFYEQLMPLSRSDPKYDTGPKGSNLLQALLVIHD